MFSKNSLFPIVAFLSFATCQDVFTFINPPPSGASGDFSNNLKFRQNSVQNITWLTEIEWISLILVQNNNADPDGSHTLLRNVTNPNTFTWTVDISTFDVANRGNVFYLSVLDQRGGDGIDQPSGGFTCHYFNITAAAASSSSSTTSPTSSASKTSTASASASSITSPSASSTTSPSSSNHSKALGIGFGVGFPAVFIAGGLVAWYVLWFKKKQRSNQAASYLKPAFQSVSQADKDVVNELPTYGHTSAWDTQPVKYTAHELGVPNGRGGPQQHELA